MIVYSTAPIDNFTGWHSPGALYDSEAAKHGQWYPWSHWEENWEKAQKIAQELGWEGDIREGPYVSMLPVVSDWSEILIAWKQDNNGTTFIAAPYRLPGLEREGWDSKEG